MMSVAVPTTAPAASESSKTDDNLKSAPKHQSRWRITAAHEIAIHLTGRGMFSNAAVSSDERLFYSLTPASALRSNTRNGGDFSALIALTEAEAKEGNPSALNNLGWIR